MISVLYNIILITNFKLIEMCRKSSPLGEGKGEGPTGAGGEALLSLLIPPNKRTEGEIELFLKTKEEP